MTSQPRKHHYVPQFYLAGFTLDDSKDGRLFVLDKEKRRTWTSTPKGTAHQRDFYAVDHSVGGDRMAVEKALAHWEAKWSAAVSVTIANESLPNDDSLADLMMFVAFMAVRVNRVRDVISTAIDGVLKELINLSLASKNGQERFRQILLDSGHELSDDDFERLVSFGESGEYSVNFEQTWHVQNMLYMGALLAPLLSLRKWRLWIADNSSPDLICSDSPVAATWATPTTGPMPPGFGTPNTIVSLPLSRRMALVSLIEDYLPAVPLDRVGVAIINSMTAMYANQIYSPASDFVISIADHQVGNTAELLKALRALGEPTSP